MKYCLLSLVFLVAVFSGHATSDELARLSGLNSPNYHRVDSQSLKRPLHVHVRLPEGYKSTEKVYPTVYLLDGNLVFPLLAAYYRYLRLGEEVPEMILVGISYSGETFEDGNFRSTDFTAPSAERDFWGGAPIFQSMLRDELIPLIEQTYRSDSSRRIIFGQSLGGQFVLYTALTDPGLFWGFVASNPALHRNLPFFLENHGPRESSRARVFVSSGSRDDARFRAPALAWIDYWSNEATPPWPLMAVTLEDQTHFSAPPAAFRAGTAWLFSDIRAGQESPHSP